MNHQLGVGESLENSSLSLELLAQYRIVVEFAVDDSVDVAFQVVEWLITALQIDDGKPSMTET